MYVFIKWLLSIITCVLQTDQEGTIIIYRRVWTDDLQGWKKSGNLWWGSDKNQPVSSVQIQHYTTINEMILQTFLELLAIYFKLTKYPFFHNHSINVYTILVNIVLLTLCDFIIIMQIDQSRSHVICNVRNGY